MAHDPIAAADLLIINDKNALDAGASSILDDAPLIRALAATTASNGTTHKWLRRTGNPAATLRALNVGRDMDSSVHETVTATMAVLDGSFYCDVAAAQSYKDGIQAFLDREAMYSLRSAFAVAESDLIYGTTISGFASLLGCNHSDDHGVVNAGGTTASTGSSVWLLRSTPDLSSVAVVLGENGVINVEEPTITPMYSSNDPTTLAYPAYFVSITAWLGCQTGAGSDDSATVHRDVCRIANLTEDANKGLTDDLLAKGLEKFASSRPPTHIVMNRRSLRQLQISRTSYHPTGAPAPRPMEYEGIPIIVTDAIVNTETLLSAA